MATHSWKIGFYFIPTTLIYMLIILTNAKDVTNAVDVDDVAVILQNKSTTMMLENLTEVNYSTVTAAPTSESTSTQQTPPMNTTVVASLSYANSTTSSRPPDTSLSTTTSIAPIQIQRHNQVELPNTPADCSQREKLRKQPIPTSSSRLRKCCPFGENLDFYRENQSDSQCDRAVHKFEPIVITAELYDNCIDDLEVTPELTYEIGNPCNSVNLFSSFLYNSEEDLLFIMQNGDLLILDKNSNESYAVEENYCVDQDKSGIMIAFVCITQVEEVSKAKIIIVAVLMLVSMPCLLLVTYLHLTLKLLRNLHGWSLALMSLCLACGYFVYSVVHIYGIPSGGFIGYVIQFFILSFFFWYFCICCNVLLNIWYKLPYYVQLNKTGTILNFIAYLLIAITGPAILVSLTVQKGLPGMPSYFLQGITESIRESQRYFIPPVSTMLGLSFLVLVVAFFGFQRIKSDGYLLVNDEEKDSVTPRRPFDIEKYEDVKKDAKCVALLGIIVVLAWLFEIVTFYSPGNEVYLLLCDMINGLQGLWIMLIFLVVRRRRTIILRWWHDRGSHLISEGGTELQPVNKAANPS
ncbi:probable G-protein coupled receptor Mth-like 14 isoform X1 [Drosophila albomicans]|uniref:Probable G-protein coupled receptor Mth-like 14 isoform X1 n=1 Tax=Drosophila albomicans TaxID=7291 RepID=A0A6P8WVS3_DROAB|nr:probable G-protein coupled receptor Mth-like 14 isoform X1 [Drosophila albomicans]XP_034102566.1 probable G-protein coupled receptor Mth-like 14 isoform X1 [Drosophila albomicans]